MLRRLVLFGLLGLLAACATASRLDAASDVHALLVAIRDEDRTAFDARVDREALKAEIASRLARETSRLKIEGLDQGRLGAVAAFFFKGPAGLLGRVVNGNRVARCRQLASAEPLRSASSCSSVAVL